jgi:hypothetical protein
VLEQLAKDEHISVRVAVARNPSAPVGVLEQLAKDYYDMGVHAAVARNPSTPVGVLEQLAKDDDIGVRVAVARNPSTPKIDITSRGSPIATVPIGTVALDLSRKKIASLEDIGGLDVLRPVMLFLDDNHLTSLKGFSKLLAAGVKEVWLAGNRDLETLDGIQDSMKGLNDVYVNLMDCPKALGVLEGIGAAIQVDLVDEIDGIPLGQCPALAAHL